MSEIFDYLKAEAGFRGLQIRIALARADLAVRRLMLDEEFAGLRCKIPDVLGEIELDDLRAIHYNCTPPNDSELNRVDMNRIF